MKTSAEQNRIRRIRRTLRKYGYFLSKAPLAEAWKGDFLICDAYTNALIAQFRSIEDIEDWLAQE